MAARRGTLRQAVRLWRIYAYLDFLWVTRSLASFLLYTVADVVYALASVAGVWLLAQRFGGIGAWNRDQVLFLLGYGMTVRGIPDMLLNYNVLHLSRRIGRGQLDHVLVQPRPVWMVLLTEGFVPWSGALYVLPGAVLLALAAHRIAAPAWPGWSVLLLVDLTASSAVLVATSVLWSSLAFPYPRAAEEISSHAVDMMTQLRAYPLDRVGTRLTGALVTVLPVAFVAWLPCRSLAGVTPSLWPALVTPLFAAAICAVAAAAFRAGLAHYLLAGSQRYLPHGHRR